MEGIVWEIEESEGSKDREVGRGRVEDSKE